MSASFLASELTEVADIAVEGRLEMLALHGRTLILDVAHNPGGAAFLVEQLRLRGIAPKVVICGMLKDKPHAQVCGVIEDAFNPTWCLIDTHGWRAYSAQDLLQSSTVQQARVFENLQQLKQHLLSVSSPGDVILAFGSFSAVEQCQTLGDAL